MSAIVQARCPQCKEVLRIPNHWLQKPMRCKHCQQVFQARAKTAAPPASAAPIPAAKAKDSFAKRRRNNSPILQSTPPTVSDRHRRKVGRLWIALVAVVAFVGGAMALAVKFGPQLFETAEKGNGERERNRVVQAEDKSPRPRGDNQTKKTTPGDPVEAGKAAKTSEPNGEIENSANEKPIDSGKIKPTPPAPNSKNSVENGGKGKKKNNPSPPVKKKFYPQGKYPRRALAISISDYLLANPLAYGESRSEKHPGSSAREVLNAFGSYYMKFPNTQLFEVSDKVKNSEVPLKPVIESAISQFVGTSRPQDRIVVFFAGHITMDAKEKNLFLVPIEGDFDDPKSLIPLSWVYRQLEDCPARQKLLILDVCRFDPARGFIRRSEDSLTEAMHQRLSDPPAGVQVWVACSKDQYSYGFEKGSLFQEALCAAMSQRLAGLHYPDEPLPLDQILPRVNKYLKERLPSDLAQESKIYGRAPAGGAAFDPDEPAAAQLNLRPPSLPGGTAGKAVVMSILKEINSAPPPRSDMARAQSLSYQALPPFSSNVLAEYEVDGYGNEKEFLNKEKIFPLRAAVVKAKQVLQEHDRNFKMKDFFGGNSTEQVKAKVKKEQDDPGKAFFFLNEAHRELVAAEKYLDQEPSKRWKAHYYYVLARLKTHLISVLEYNTMLAQIRTDSLPELPMGAVGFRIASKERPSCRKGEVRTWRRELDELWPKIINDFPETPWAILAKREKDTALGMEWRPAQN